MADRSLDSFSTRSNLTVGGKTFTYFSLEKFAKSAGMDVGRLPFSLRILLENLLRCEDGLAVTKTDVLGLAKWNAKAEPDTEIAFHPARVILQDFTGVPCVVDLAAMRDAMAKMGGDPAKINPLFPSELVIDHSVQVDYFGTKESLGLNAKLEFDRNVERYQLLRWGQKAFDNFKVVPPDQGIVHQVNLEYLARVVFDKDGVLYPDSLVGTDSHTTMINGIGVVGWGVGGIEAEAAMLGQPINLLVPNVIGFKLFGKLPSGSTATDLVLTVTRMLRDKGVVGKFVEFYGDGVGGLPLADRATIANMSPEFGSTIGIFPIDAETLAYLKATARSERATLVEAYARAQGLFREQGARDPEFTDTLELDLSTVVPTLAGPRRPHDKVRLTDMKATWQKVLPELITAAKGDPKDVDKTVPITMEDGPTSIGHGSVVIAAITSCTNTSNPSVLIAAGLLAKKAVEKGLTTKPWVKSSLAPGSKVVTQYLGKAGLLTALEALKFNVVGYGCTTCIGNSGPLPDAVAGGITQGNLVACAVLSGNRNFEGRINPHVRGNYLASPPLVVAYALSGRVDIDYDKEPIGKGKDGADVFLRDIWPSAEEVSKALGGALSASMFESEYKGVFDGDESWQKLAVPEGNRFGWDEKSTYIRKPTFFDDVSLEPAPLKDIHGARVLLALGDFVTTDHISPAGNIAKDSAAARYLVEHGVQSVDFNSYGARRGNHEVMVRGTFANTRLRNALAQGKEGSWSRHLPGTDVISVYDASVKYQAEGVPLVVLAGKEYGSGSSRDWAAKGTYMLGVRAVIAQSYERIHRSNLIGMGVLPLQLAAGQSWESLGLSGEEIYDIDGVAANLSPGKHLSVKVTPASGAAKTIDVLARIDTVVELEYYRHGGILQYVLRQLLKGKA
jgi:aconitate hydratase